MGECQWDAVSDLKASLTWKCQLDIKADGGWNIVGILYATWASAVSYSGQKYVPYVHAPLLTQGFQAGVHWTFSQVGGVVLLLFHFDQVFSHCDAWWQVFSFFEFRSQPDVWHGQKVFSSAQIYSFWVMLTGCWGRCSQVSHCHPRLWKLK